MAHGNISVMNWWPTWRYRHFPFLLHPTLYTIITLRRINTSLSNGPFDDTFISAGQCVNSHTESISEQILQTDSTLPSTNTNSNQLQAQARFSVKPTEMQSPRAGSVSDLDGFGRRPNLSWSRSPWQVSSLAR